MIGPDPPHPFHLCSIDQLAFMETLLRDERLAPLSRYLRPGEGECPFVVRDSHRADVRLTHFSPGRDATYVVIQSSKLEKVIIGYAPFVEGTALIYDVTAAAMQGKARPFECDLRIGGRVYALLPVQIEAIRVALRGRRIEVEFGDARGERVEAALPFVLLLQTASRKVGAAYSCTDRDGRFVREIAEVEADELLSVTVRSLVTGCEERTALQR